MNRQGPRRPRLPVRVPAVTEPIGTSGGPDVGEIQNLSQGGMLLRLEKAMVPGSPVRVTLSLRNGPPLILAGTVAWVHPHPDFPGWALGIRFGEELPGEMVAEIADAEQPPWPAPPR